MIRRVYAEKKQGADSEAGALLHEIGANLGIKTVENVRILYRYDVDSARPLPLAEALSDAATEVGVRADLAGARVFAAEPLGGQFDEAARAAEACLALYTDEPLFIRAAKVYALYGNFSEEELSAIKAYILRPGKMREASLALPFAPRKEAEEAQEVETLFGFRDLDMGALCTLSEKYGFDMGASELSLLQDHFKSEYRDPTVAELALFDALGGKGLPMLCAPVDGAEPEGKAAEKAYAAYLAAREELEEGGPVSLRDIASIPRRLLKKRAPESLGEVGGYFAAMFKARRAGKEERWALTLTEGVAFPANTYAATELFCTADPILGTPVERRELCMAMDGAAETLSSAGIAAAQVASVYHSGYGEPLFVGAYLAAVPAEELKYSAPVPGDKVILIGSLTHPLAGEKLRRLFSEKKAADLIKCAGPIGAGGIALAAASLADGIDLDLDSVPAGREGEGAVERMLSAKGVRTAVVTEAREADGFIRMAEEEGLEAVAIATVTEIPRLILRWKGKVAVNLSHTFLMNCGAGRHAEVRCSCPARVQSTLPADFTAGMRALADDVNFCSGRGQGERFDHAAGGRTVLPPFGGNLGLTPPQAAVHRLFPEKGVCYTAWGGDACTAGESPFHGAYFAVVESVSKLVAAGADFKDVYLTLTETLPREEGSEAWGKAFLAVLGACKAQLDLGIASVGERYILQKGAVPPATFSIALTTGAEREVILPAFKGAGHKVVLLAPNYDESGLPVPHSLVKNFKIVTALMRADKVLAAYALGRGGVAEAILKCCLGNEIGFRFADMVSMETVFGAMYGAFILELNDETAVGEELGRTTLSETVARGLDLVPLVSLRELFEGKLSPVYHAHTAPSPVPAENFTSFKKSAYISGISGKPRVLLPLFAGMGGGDALRRIFSEAGAEAETFYVKTGTREETARAVHALARRIAESDVLFLADGRAGDHVCGLAKYIATCLRTEDVQEAVGTLLKDRGGLVGGVGLGFDVLLRLGLLPYGKVAVPAEDCPVLMRGEAHAISRTVDVRISSAASPWLCGLNAGDIVTATARLGGGLVCPDALVKALAADGQVSAQFCDGEGNASADARFDPSGSAGAVEGLLSPDGRVIGSLTGFFLQRRKN